MIKEIRLGDILELRKKHPCGGNRWEVFRLGADIGIKCLTCQHRLLIERSLLERRIKSFVSKAVDPAKTGKSSELENRIDELKKSFPPHSVPPSMWQELETLEEELARIKDGEQNAG